MSSDNGGLGPGVTVIRIRNNRMRREIVTKGLAFLAGAAVGAGALCYAARAERKVLIDRIGAQGAAIVRITNKNKTDAKVISDLTEKNDKFGKSDYLFRVEIEHLKRKRAVAKKGATETILQETSTKPISTVINASAAGKKAGKASQKEKRNGFFGMFR